MTWELFSALFAFAAISSFTPGPNNTLLMASGINHGLSKTLPMMLGVIIGFPAMIAVVGFGLAQIFQVYPILYTAMKYLGAAYLLWLAWKIAMSTPSASGENTAQPLSFFQAAGFQWINPKGWTMAVAALSTYTIPTSYLFGVAIVALTFMFTGVGSSFTWVLFGTGLRNALTDPRWFRMINIALACTLIISLVPMLWH
jgi:threonine/homoserine/homoserine lactone efflux protein